MCPRIMLNVSKEGSMNGGIGYIYPSFTETVNFLKGKGIPADKRLSDYEILKIVAVTQEKILPVLGPITAGYLSKGRP